jgi:hypothetical protein
VTEPIETTAAGLDLSPRILASTTVVSSPTGSEEVIVASVTIPDDLAVSTGVLLRGWVAFTVGSSGVSGQLRIRQTNVTGTAEADTGATTGQVAAGKLVAMSVEGVDAGPTLPGQVYKLTLQVASGATASAVSAAVLSAVVV